MDAIILAAGYATRLYPLTENTPKPLLKAAGKPIIEHIMGKLEELDTVDKIYIVTNDKFEKHFLEWIHNFDAKKPVEIINDRTKSNEDRLGALGDVHYVINTKKIDDDIITIAGDNLFELSLHEVVAIFDKRRHNVIVLYDVKDIELAKHYGVVDVKDNIVMDFEEKPNNPKSTLISTGIYLFPKKTIDLIEKYISQGNNADKTGDFIEWLHKRDKVYAYVTEKTWYDIGNLEQLKKADKHYKG
jgi:glucose-1-phosphate thymidylyltransferase